MSDKSPDGATEARTMWSESLFESLYLALRKEKGDEVIMTVLKEIKAKEYTDNYIFNKVKKKLGPTAGARVGALLGGKPVASHGGSHAKPLSKAGQARATSANKRLSKADQARANAARKRTRQGWFEKLKAMFTKK